MFHQFNHFLLKPRDITLDRHPRSQHVELSSVLIVGAKPMPSLAPEPRSVTLPPLFKRRGPVIGAMASSVPDLRLLDQEQFNLKINPLKSKDGPRRAFPGELGPEVLAPALLPEHQQNLNSWARFNFLECTTSPSEPYIVLRCN